MRRCAVVLAALAACVEPPPDLGEMVVYQLTEIGEVQVSGGTIRWTDGHDPTTVRAASLDAIPIGNRETTPVGDTRQSLVVHGDSVYLVDMMGVVAVTDGVSARAVNQLGVDRAAVTEDGTLYWAHGAASLSWYGQGGLSRSAFVDANTFLDVALVQGQLYGTTVGSYVAGFNTYQRGKLFSIDRATGQATQLADAGDFAGDFVDDGHFGAGDEYFMRGLHAFDDKLYVEVSLDVGSSEYDQKLVVHKTATGFTVVVPPQKHTSEVWVHDGTFYWMSYETNADTAALWRMRPGGTPEHVIDGFVRAVTIADGYIYGYVKSISIDGWDLRRVALAEL